MKNITILCLLLSALVLVQSCAPKSNKVIIELTAAEPQVATAKLVTLITRDEIAITRVKITIASAEKEARSKPSIAEKAKATPTYKDTSGKIVHYKADVDASYTGGFDELRQNLKNRDTYPGSARETDNEGTFIADFFVDEKGRIRDVITTEVVSGEVDISFQERLKF